MWGGGKGCTTNLVYFLMYKVKAFWHVNDCLLLQQLLLDAKASYFLKYRVDIVSGTYSISVRFEINACVCVFHSTIGCCRLTQLPYLSSLVF